MRCVRFPPQERARLEREAEACVLERAMMEGRSLTAAELHRAIDLHLLIAEAVARGGILTESKRRA